MSDILIIGSDAQPISNRRLEGAGPNLASSSSFLCKSGGRGEDGGLDSPPPLPFVCNVKKTTEENGKGKKQYLACKLFN